MSDGRGRRQTRGSCWPRCRRAPPRCATPRRSCTPTRTCAPSTAPGCGAPAPVRRTELVARPDVGTDRRRRFGPAAATEATAEIFRQGPGGRAAASSYVAASRRPVAGAALESAPATVFRLPAVQLTTATVTVTAPTSSPLRFVSHKPATPHTL